MNVRTVYGSSWQEWGRVQAIQDLPFIWIQFNGYGFKWDYEIHDLVQALRNETIDPSRTYWTDNPHYCIENPEWGRFRSDTPESRYLDGPSMYRVNVTHFGVGFTSHAWVAGIDTNHTPTIRVLKSELGAVLARSR